jgi:F420-dependent oxidoreductase-like protein
MRFGLNVGYSGAKLSVDMNLVHEAERVGFHSVWTAEAYGSDAVTPLAWIGGQTSKIHLGSAIMQMPARTPAMTASTATSLDQLSGGRFLLGLGVSGPQVVEGWHGQRFGKPLVKTREYVSIVRKIWAREEPVVHRGEHYQIPYAGADATGLGKPLRSILHGRQIPIYIAAIGPKSVEQTAEIADGWLPLYYSPFRPEVYADQLAAAKPGFEIAVIAAMNVTDDVAAGLWPVQAMLGFYIGGMGAKGQNYHTKLMARMGFEEEAYKIQDLFFAGKRDEAIAAVPQDFADEISLVGPPSRIRERLDAWEKTPVTTLIVSAQSTEQMKQLADLVLG